MGKFSTETSDPREEIIAFTDDSFAVGDLALLTEVGRVQKLDDTTELVLESDNTEGLTTVLAPESYAAVNSAPLGVPFTVQMGKSIVMLSSPALNSGIQIRKESLYGKNSIIAATVMTGTTNTILLIKLSETRVAAIWGTSGSALRCRIYDEELNLVGSEISVSSDHLGGYGYCHACKLLNGNLLIAYRRNTGTNISAKIFTPEAVLVGSEITITGDAGTSISVVDLPSGNFAVSWFSTTYKFARFGSTGVPVGSAVSIAGSTNEFSNGFTGMRLVGLTADSLAVVAGNSAAKPQIDLYNSSNTLLTTLTPAMLNLQYDHIPGLCKTDQGFALAVHGTATDVIIFHYDISGNLLSTSTLIFSTNWTSSPTSGGLILKYISKFGFFLFRVASTVNVGYGLVTLSDKTLGSVVEFAASTSCLFGDVHLSATGLLSLYYDRDSVGYRAKYNTLRKNILGVALAASASNQVRLARKGNYTLNVSFSSPAIFDGRTHSVPGVKGIIEGNRATLFGASV